MPDAKTPENRTSKQRLEFPSSTTLRESETMRQEILSRISRGSVLELDLAKVEEIDVSFIQLLLSADITAAKSGSTLHLMRPLPEAVSQTLARCGLPGELVGPLDPTANIWTREA